MYIEFGSPGVERCVRMSFARGATGPPDRIMLRLDRMPRNPPVLKKLPPVRRRLDPGLGIWRAAPLMVNGAARTQFYRLPSAPTNSSRPATLTGSAPGCRLFR